MKYGWMALILCCALNWLSPQSGRVRHEDAAEKPPAKVAGLNTDSARPVLVNMSPEDFQASGLNKLSESELDRLDRWFLELLVKLQSLPSGQTLTFDPSGDKAPGHQMAQWQHQQLESRVRELELRLAAINQDASQMAFDLSQARNAAARGDWSYVQSSLFNIESATNRIQRASQ